MPSTSTTKPVQKSKKSISQVKKLFFLIILFFISVSTYSQPPVADFFVDIDKGCAPLTVQFNNISSNFDSVLWVFGDGATSNELSFVEHTFLDDSYHRVRLYVFKTTTGEKDSVSHDIDQAPSANLVFDTDKSEYCIDELVELTYSGNTFDSLRWSFGDGQQSVKPTNPIYHKYTTGGTKTIKLFSHNGVCSDTAEQTVTVLAMSAEFDQSAISGCEGDSVTFTLTGYSGVDSYTWKPLAPIEEGVQISDVNPYTHKYEYSNVFVPELYVAGGGKWCIITGDTLRISKVEAKIVYDTISEFCTQRNVYFKGNTSITRVVDTLLFNWDFGNGETSTSVNPVESFDIGEYIIKLEVSNGKGCDGTEYDTIIINNLPEITLGNDTIICYGDSAQLWAEGGHEILWSPTIGITDRFAYNPKVKPEVTSIYEPFVTDTLTGCQSIRGSVTQTVTVIQPPDLSISVKPADTSIWLGGIAAIFADSIAGYVYSWSPDEYISCTNCANTQIFPITLGENTYVLTVSDVYNCASLDYDVLVEVIEKYIIGVPEAFTPNGDGINDIIKVDGLGVEELIEFSVYNRWGKVVYSTNSMDEGWDGKVDGVEQPVDTYTYLIKAKMYNDTQQEERGSFTLIR